ncbi:integrase [Thiocystis minor]|nr:integrase [Thiocystis minor]
MINNHLQTGFGSAGGVQDAGGAGRGTGVEPLPAPWDSASRGGSRLATRLPAALVEPLFAPPGWLATPSPLIASALAAAAPNTRQAWAADWGVFRAWCLGPAARHCPARADRITLPTPPALLAAFIADQVSGEGTHDARPRTLTTVRRYLSTLATLHRLLELPDPGRHPLVRNTLKAHARGGGEPGQAAPLRWERLADILAVLPDDLEGWRDRALLVIGHNTLARRAELVALDVADLNWLDDGAALVAVRPTKTDLEARVELRYLSPPASAVVRTWLARSGLRDGPLVTRLQRNGAARLGQREAGGRLSAGVVNRIVKEAVGRLAEARGELAIPADSARRAAWRAYARAWSGHSLRVGAAQDMAAAGVSTAAILQAGGWKDVRMIKRYLRHLRALDGGMAQWYASQRARAPRPRAPDT